jgi:Pentapeptide repeats (8 copies)
VAWRRLLLGLSGLVALATVPALVWATRTLDQNHQNEAALTVRAVTSQVLPGLVVAFAVVAVESVISRARALDARAHELSPLGTLVGGDFYRRNLDYLSLSGRDFSDSNLGEATMRHAVLRHTKFVGADMFSADLSGADIFEADFSGADLTGADLRGVRGFRSANFERVVSDGSTLWPPRHKAPRKLDYYFVMPYDRKGPR